MDFDDISMRETKNVSSMDYSRNTLSCSYSAGNAPPQITGGSKVKTENKQKKIEGS